MSLSSSIPTLTLILTMTFYPLQSSALRVICHYEYGAYRRYTFIHPMSECVDNYVLVDCHKWPSYGVYVKLPDHIYVSVSHISCFCEYSIDVIEQNIPASIASNIVSVETVNSFLQSDLATRHKHLASYFCVSLRWSFDSHHRELKRVY